MKKGISPIISTVLLIALTVVLFLFVSNWIQKSIVKESMEKTEEKLAGQLDCLSTSIDIADVCVDNAASAAKVQLNVDNTGDTNIDGLTIRVIGSNVGTVEYKASSAVAPLGRILSKSTVNDITGGPVVTANKVEVYPKIDGKLCKDQSDSTSNVKSPC